MRVDPARITGIEFSTLPGKPMGSGDDSLTNNTFVIDFDPTTSATPTTVFDNPPAGARGPAVGTTIPVTTAERAGAQAIADAVRASELLTLAAPNTPQARNTQNLVLHTDDGAYVISQDALWSKPESALVPIERAIGRYLIDARAT